MSNSDWKPIVVMDASTGGKLTTVNPAEIVVLPECQARVDGTDDTLVAEYAADMREYDERIKESESEYPTHGWQEFPNINCIHVPDIGHVLISGHHRLQAILEVGYEEILTYSVPGTRQDAIVWSKQQNADNGKRRTNADKAHVVKSCLLDDELKLWSNRTIAKWCDVTHGTVAKHEKALVNFTSANGEPYTRPTRRKRLSNTGEIEWIETASIGNGSQSNKEDGQSEPEASEIEQAKTEHTHAWSALQSAFFDTSLDKHKRFSEFEDTDPGRKLYLFYELTVEAKDMRPNTFSHDFYFEVDGERGRDLTLAEIKAEAEFIQRIAKDIQFYQQGDDCHLGWLEKVLEMEPEQQDTETESPKQSVDRRENGCRARLRGILEEHHKLDSTTYNVGALAKEFDLYAVRVEVIARDLVTKETEKAQNAWQKAWTKVRSAWFDYEELSKSVEWETFTAAVLEQTDVVFLDMVFLTEDTFENPDERLKSTDLELLENEKNCLTTLGYHIRNPSFWVRDLIPDSEEQPKEQAEKTSDENISERSLDDRKDKLYSDLRINHWQHTYSWKGLDLTPFAEQYDLSVDVIAEIQKEIAVEHPKPESEQTEADSPSLGEKTEMLKLQIREYLPTWKQNNPDTVYATLFHLCDARFRMKHGIPRGRSPFFFEELDDLFPLMKANDLELADKVREILATDASGVKSAVVESESPVESEVSKETLVNDRKETSEAAEEGTPNHSEVQELTIQWTHGNGLTTTYFSDQRVHPNSLKPHPLSELPDALKVELLKLAERLNKPFQG